MCNCYIQCAVFLCNNCQAFQRDGKYSRGENVAAMNIFRHIGKPVNIARKIAALYMHMKPRHNTLFFCSQNVDCCYVVNIWHHFHSQRPILCATVSKILTYCSQRQSVFLTENLRRFWWKMNIENIHAKINYHYHVHVSIRFENRKTNTESTGSYSARYLEHWASDRNVVRV